MALTAPTAPTPPTPPVVPGARQSSSQDGNAGQEAGNGASAAAEMGRGFGVHITINPPGQADSGKGGGQENTVVQTVPPGQQAEAAVRTDNPWYLPSGNMSFMTFLPFLIVFVAAFITFTLRNLSKKDGVAKPGSREQGKSSTRKAAGREQQEKLLRTVQPVTAQKEEKSKGRHFEMRI